MATAPRRAFALLAVIALAAATGCGDDDQPQTFGSFATSTTDSTTEQGSTADLVPEGERAAVTAVLMLIDSGGALPYSEDGAIFQNREGLLPDQPIGYYREYTVPTPDSDDRGTRRLVIGENGETYYTNDHYSSFVQIDPEDFQ